MRLIVFGVFLGLGSLGFGQDQFEPNDSQGAATTLPSKASWHGRALGFDEASDEDWFKIQAGYYEPHTISIRYQHNIFNSSHASFQVVNSSGAVVASPTGFLVDFGTNYRTATFTPLVGESYYIRYYSLGGTAVSYRAG